MSTFPSFQLSGGPSEIASQSAAKFGPRILDAVNFYEGLFAQIAGKEREDFAHLARIRSEADRYSSSVNKTFPGLAEEITAMAAALGIEAWRLHALNARTEIYRTLASEKNKRTENECTSIFFPESRVLGQTWDWHPGLEKLALILKIEQPQKPAILMFSEPGIVGKIGLNSSGLGVCLTLLFAETAMGGVPIHVLQRAILECQNADEAARLIERTDCCTTSSILIADKTGAAYNFELLGQSKNRVALPAGNLVHTNHYLADETSASAAIPGSVHRLKTAAALFGANSSDGVPGMKRILGDKSNADFPICRQYAPGLDFLVGTVAAMVMDLKNLSLEVTKEPAYGASPWVKHSLP